MIPAARLSEMIPKKIKDIEGEGAGGMNSRAIQRIRDTEVSPAMTWPDLFEHVIYYRWLIQDSAIRDKGRRDWAEARYIKARDELLRRERILIRDMALEEKDSAEVAETPALSGAT